MKRLQLKIKRTALPIFAMAALCAPSVGQAANMDSVLDGMYTNITNPQALNSQLRGSISGGSVYLRTPVQGIQPIAIDPPRFSAGCGGIDLYLGSFSFITAEKLTQFLRSVAQNAAPLAFKMAIDTTWPLLGGLLDKFQHMAQMMNDSQRNSCQLATGIMTDAKVPGDLEATMMKVIGNTTASAQGWADDFTKAFTSTQEKPSDNVRQAAQLKNEVDQTKPKFNELGNTTWNAMRQRSSAFKWNIDESPEVSKQIIMSMLGTTVRTAGAGNAEPDVKYYGQRIRLKDLVTPSDVTTKDTALGVPSWACNETIDCNIVTPSNITTYGITGYVQNKMFGAPNAQQVTGGLGIIGKLKTCSSATNTCGLNSSELAFLNSLGKIPAVGLLMQAQKIPGVIDTIAPEIVSQMVVEFAVLYGRNVVDIANTTYSNTSLAKPEGFEATMGNMYQDLRSLEAMQRENIARVNQIAAYIDSARRANGSVTSYRPVAPGRN
jgi:conjugative transfer pilus assembly protein TraH